MSRWLSGWSGLFSLILIGCAWQRPAEDYAVGKRIEDQVEVAFIPKLELTIAGLIDDAIGMYKKGRKFYAEQRLRQARYLAPESERVLYNLAVVIGEPDQADESVEILNNLVARSPYNVDYQIALGHALYADHRLAEAISVYKRAFKLVVSAGNYSRASSLARSISTAAYEIGNEQEALCYSAEAYTQAPSPEQAFQHGRMLMALALFDSARRFLAAHEKSFPVANLKAGMHYLMAISSYSSGHREIAQERINLALDLIGGDPMVAAEISAAWWLMQPSRLDRQDEFTLREVSDEEVERLERIRDAAIEFAKSYPRVISYWPPELLERLQDLREYA